MGHTLNGSSLSQAGELTVSTACLNWVRFEEVGTVTAGGGSACGRCVILSKARISRCPYHEYDGYGGPSVGGFVAAGGFGVGSADFGGFSGRMWLNIDYARLPPE